MSSNEKISIIGFGRFGQVLAKLLQQDFDVSIYDTDPIKNTQQLNVVDFKTALKSDTLFIAVPISAFENCIKEIAGELLSKKTIIDVCSIKIHPVTVMKKYLPEFCTIIATHPMFGPDSYNTKAHLPMMMHSVRDNENKYAFWRNFFAEKFTIVEMTPEEHDQKAAYSQGITHAIGRLLDAMNVQSTPIDTLGFKMLLQVKQQTCQDSWQLFQDLFEYNPYSKDMLADFERAFQELRTKL